MAGYTQKENVRRVVIVGIATAKSKGLSAVYTANSSHEDIPDDDDWSNKTYKQLRVKPAVYFKDAANDTRLHFNVNIPSNFFNEDDKFTASPRYKRGEGLHVKLTGNGSEAGYIDMNVEGRGAGGNSVVTEEGCAKWS